MDPLTALSAQFDPLRPLEADETDLYVDWQEQLDIADDVKGRLANSIARSPGPVTRLFTGHRGSGKTTELNRVRQRLQDGLGGHRVFVSMLFAEQWVDFNDVQPEDLVFQIVRQLVTDLKQVGFTFAETSFRNALGGLRDFFRGRVGVDSADVGIDPLNVSLRFEAFPTARKELPGRHAALRAGAADLPPDRRPARRSQHPGVTRPAGNRHWRARVCCCGDGRGDPHLRRHRSDSVGRKVPG